MWRYCLLALLSTPVLWLAYGDWQQAQQNSSTTMPPMPAILVPATSVPAGISSEEFNRQTVWLLEPEKISGDVGDNAAPAIWVRWQMTARIREKMLKRVASFAHAYRKGIDWPGEEIERTDDLSRAITARQIEVVLFSRRKENVRVESRDWEECLGRLKRYPPEQSEAHNKQWHKLIKEGWMDGNELLNEHTEEKRKELLLEGLDQRIEKLDEPLFSNAQEKRASQKVKALRAWVSASEKSEFLIDKERKELERQITLRRVAWEKAERSDWEVEQVSQPSAESSSTYRDR